MLSRAEALELVLAKAPALRTEVVPLLSALGRISASALLSSNDLPPFDNSAMDGYAARSFDIASASPEKPVFLKVIGKVAAGQSLSGSIQQMESVRIFTGSMLPQGADCVVMQEETLPPNEQDQTVGVTSSCAKWENIRFKGEDVRIGASLVGAGERLNAGSQALLAACGIGVISVFKKPRVALLSTGAELVAPGNPLPPGKIYESNQVMLSGLLNSIGIQPTLLPPVSDLGGDLQASIKQALDQHDVLITTGGVSVGEFDLVKSSFQKIGGKLELWRISIKPGKPLAFGTLGDRQLFGLPGNPVSAFVTFLLMCRPALLNMQGAVDFELPSQVCELTTEVENRGDRAHFMRMCIDNSGMVSPAGTQASHILYTLGKTNGLLEVPPRSRLARGARVKVLRIGSD
ncbi:MAG: Molybdopterin molybdenumtransferase MoeA [Verrucomicrobiales bacterium]|nr:Molybdopterin molybdenumtransferase MoeA [Verrucomicrobiales bacterium]